jgi:gluconokinase
VAFDTFASSMVPVDADGSPLMPCMTYADSRPHAEVDRLREEIAESELHQLTGTRAHSSYWPARLRWLREERQEVFSRAARFLSLSDYVLERITGTAATGTSTAAWTGMVDRRTADWSDEVLALAGVERSQLAVIRHLDQPLEIDAEHRESLARRWPALAEASWFAGIADGLSANVGLGAHDERTIGGTAATSGALRVLVRELPEELPGGLWCYRVSHDRSLVGGALNDVGRALGWTTRTLGLEEIDRERMDEVLGREPDASTPLVLPFFTGERSTGWASNARAVFTGVSADSDPDELYRGVVEGIALSYARIAGQLRQLAPGAEGLHAGGSVMAEHPGALQVVSDVLGIPLTPVTIKRSTLLGTALLALETVAPGVERIGPQHAPAIEPVEDRAGYYGERADRFERVYDALFG